MTRLHHPICKSMSDSNNIIVIDPSERSYTKHSVGFHESESWKIMVPQEHQSFWSVQLPPNSTVEHT